MSTRSKLLKSIYEKYPYLLKRDIDKFFSIMIQEIKNACRRSDGVEFRNWFSMRVKIQKPSTRRNPRTGDLVQVGSKNIIRFKISQELFKRINEK